MCPAASQARPRSIIPTRRPVMLQRGCSACPVMLLADGGKINNAKHAARYLEDATPDCGIGSTPARCETNPNPHAAVAAAAGRS